MISFLFIFCLFFAFTKVSLYDQVSSFVPFQLNIRCIPPTSGPVLELVLRVFGDISGQFGFYG